MKERERSDEAVGKELHEWFGWAVVAGVGLHLVTNWAAFRGHLAKVQGKVVVGAFALATVLAVAPLSGGDGELHPMKATQGAVTALANTPLERLAPLAGKDVEVLVAQLQRSGFEQAVATSTLRELAKGDRQAELRALAAVFPAPQRAAN